MTQKVVKFKWSLIREGIEIIGIWDERSSSFWVGTDFKKEGTEITFFPSFPGSGKQKEIGRVRNLHEPYAYIILPDYQCDIFNDLKVICELTQGIDVSSWSLGDMHRVIDRLRKAIYYESGKV